MAVRFFNLPKNKTFNYTPRYYDEQKEDLEKRIQQAKQELGINDNDDKKPYVSTIRKGQMKSHSKHSAEQRRKSSGRLFLIIVILAILVYILLYM